MKKFKNVYQNYYNKINLNKEKKEEIFNNIVNNNQKYKKIYYRQKLITITCSILIICLISTGIVFAKDIVKNIYKIIKQIV